VRGHRRMTRSRGFQGPPEDPIGLQRIQKAAQDFKVL